jgi:MSHA biogenesis protein MshL
MHKILTIALVTTLLLNGCTSPPSKRDTYDKISAEVASAAAKPAAVSQNDAVASALLPPVSQLADQLPKARPALEERFNVSFNNVPVQQFFNSIVAGTRYNMLVHPDVSGTITANLKDVTLPRRWTRCARCTATTTRIEGTRIYDQAADHADQDVPRELPGRQPRGVSNLRVSSTSVSNAGTSNGGNQQRRQQ